MHRGDLVGIEDNRMTSSGSGGSSSRSKQATRRVEETEQNLLG